MGLLDIVEEMGWYRGSKNHSRITKEYLYDCPEIRQVPGFEGYFITNDGRIKTHWRKTRHKYGRSGSFLTLDKTFTRWVKPIYSPNTHYKWIWLKLGEKGKLCQIHQLVMLAFIGPCPIGYEVGHKNGISVDNRLENLKYCTPEENQADRILHGTSNQGTGSKSSKLTEEQVKEILVNKTDSGEALGARYRVDRSTINRIKRRESWQNIEV